MARTTRKTAAKKTTQRKGKPAPRKVSAKKKPTPRKKPAKRKPEPACAHVVGTQPEVAAALSVSAHTVNDWVRAGMPGAPGAYDLFEIARWRLLKLRSPENETHRQRLTRAQADEKELRAQLVALELAEERGELVRVETVRKWDESRAAVLKRGLFAIGRSVAPAVLGCEDQREIEGLIHRKVRSVLERYARYHERKAKRKGKDP